jgi:hypothetical protein
MVRRGSGEIFVSPKVGVESRPAQIEPVAPFDGHSEFVRRISRGHFADMEYP